MLFRSALEAAHAIRGEVEGPYVMDLYLDDAGQPHVIELNPQSNSGLYAVWNHNAGEGYFHIDFC